MITQTYRLDMRPGASNEVVHVSQYDNDQNTLVFDLYDNGMPWTVPSGTSVLLNGKKPHNYGFSYSAVSISGNRVVFNLTTQMTAVAGSVICELRVRNGAGTQIIGTANFILAVEPAALNDETIISDTMIPLIEQAVEIASNLDRYITQTEANAEAAQEAAQTASEAAAESTIINSNVTQIYNTLEDAKTAANTAAQNANTVAANIAAAAARGDYKGEKGDTGESGVITPMSGFWYLTYEPDTGDMYVIANVDMSDAFDYDSETGNLYYVYDDEVA